MRNNAGSLLNLNSNVSPPASDIGPAIEGLPHPYYTPRTYTVDGVSGTPDPYQPFPNERLPVNAQGVVEGVLASPSRYGYPDETNTGIPLNYPLLSVDGQINITWDGVTITKNGQSTKTLRPSTNQPPVIVGPITLYPNGNKQQLVDDKVPGRPLPFSYNTLIDGAWTNSIITNDQPNHVLIRNSVLNGTDKQYGAIFNKYQGNDLESGVSTKSSFVDCRINLYWLSNHYSTL